MRDQQRKFEHTSVFNSGRAGGCNGTKHGIGGGSYGRATAKSVTRGTAKVMGR